MVGNNIASKAVGYFGTLFWDLGLEESSLRLQPQDRPSTIARKAFGPIGKGVELDIEANRDRLQNLEHVGPGELRAGGNFHVSESTKAGMKIAASYPIILATVASPGPEDLAMLGIARALANRGFRVVSEAGEWAVKSDSGQVMARGDDAVKAFIRKEVPAPKGLVNVTEEASDRLGRWFARYGDDGAETFSARLLNGSDELGISWTGNVCQLADSIAEVQGVIGRNIPKITGVASDGLEATIKAGRFNGDLYAQTLARRLGGQWSVEAVKRPGSDVWDIIATRLGG